MTFANFVRLFFAVCASGALLSGCTASQGTPLPSPETPGARHKVPRWPVTGSRKNLLYISYGSEVSIYDYATDTQAGTLSGFSHASGSCTGSHGDVFITNYGAADILEFAHGGTKPIGTLIDPSPYPVDCSVDPASGNLAVVNEYGQTEYSKGDVAIYIRAKGKPKVYKDATLDTFLSCTYDARGDLLVSSYKGSALSFALLALGSTELKAVSLPFTPGSYGTPYVRWDGEYFVVEF
jgi:hypothetical protein